MKIYFIRHGSTDSLEKRISQPDDEPLNKKGIEQAIRLGERLAKKQIDMVVSSPHLRAVQTAKAISPNIEVSPLFAEVRKPKEVIGKSKEDEEVRRILKKIGEMYLIDPSWHYSDEENFEDLKSRGLAALEYLKLQNRENIAVVSHGNFVALMMGLMIYGQSYPVEISLKLKNFFRLGTTGISICDFEDKRWKLVSSNDTCHLEV